MPDLPDDTGRKQRGAPPFEPGQSGNPAGRPKGSRNKLGEAFISALHDDFVEHGPQTIARVREEKPAEYVKVCASLLPKELKVSTEVDMSDEQLDHRIRQLAAALDLELRGEAGVGETSGGTEAPSRYQ